MPAAPARCLLIAALLALPGVATAQEEASSTSEAPAPTETSPPPEDRSVQVAELRRLAAELTDLTIGLEEAAPATGQILERPALRATFSEGVFHPIRRASGRLVGAVFVGSGQLQVEPEAAEGAHLERYTGRPTIDQSFDRAYLQATDGALLELFPDESWEAEPVPVRARTIFEARRGLLEGEWSWLGPDLTLDLVQDLHGEGPQGGHLYAEFRTEDLARTFSASEGRSSWVSYYRNPRGALFPEEQTAVFAHWRSGDSVQETEVWVSQSDEDSTVYSYPYDIARIDLDVTIPEAPGRNLARVEVEGSLVLSNVQPYPLEAVVLHLAEGRRRCSGDVDLGRIDLRSVRDAEGEPLPAVHFGDRLFVKLGRTLAPGEQAEIAFALSGDLLESNRISEDTPPDTYFTGLAHWNWYPRGAAWDRSATRVTLTVPHLLSGVSTGRRVEVERLSGRRERSVWENQGGVDSVFVAVGDYVDLIDEGEDDEPVIQIFAPRANDQLMRDRVTNARAMLDYFGRQWGDYPYDSFTWVDLPARASTWTCSPPGDAWAWQGFLRSTAAGDSWAYPSAAPTRSEAEGETLSALLYQTPAARSYGMGLRMARQWWGHLYGPASFRDLWISEGFASLSALLFVQASRGQASLNELQSRLHRAAVDPRLVEPLTFGVRAGPRGGPLMWARGPLFFRMLLREMGDGAFRSMSTALTREARRSGLRADRFMELVEDWGGASARQLVADWAEQWAPTRLEYQLEEFVQDGERWAVAGRARLVGGDHRVTVPIRVRQRRREETWLSLPLNGEEWVEFSATVSNRPTAVDFDPAWSTLVGEREEVRE